MTTHLERNREDEQGVIAWKCLCVCVFERERERDRENGM